MRAIDGITLNNTAALIEECLVNGESGPESLYAWYLDQKELLKRTLEDTLCVLKE